VASGGAGGDPRAPGLLHGAGAQGALRTRPGAGEPGDARRHARSRRAFRRHRDLGGAGRARAAVSIRARARRASGPAAARRVARDREARSARREAGRRRHARGGCVVVGLAELFGGGRRSRQAGSRLRLPLGARSRALRRPVDRRSRVQRLAYRRPDHVAGRRALHARLVRDHKGQRSRASRRSPATASRRQAHSSSAWSYTPRPASTRRPCSRPNAG
jgi:hypothetical protein